MSREGSLDTSRNEGKCRSRLDEVLDGERSTGGRVRFFRPFGGGGLELRRVRAVLAVVPV